MNSELLLMRLMCIAEYGQWNLRLKSEFYFTLRQDSQLLSKGINSCILRFIYKHCYISKLKQTKCKLSNSKKQKQSQSLVKRKIVSPLLLQTQQDLQILRKKPAACWQQHQHKWLAELLGLAAPHPKVEAWGRGSKFLAVLKCKWKSWAVM